LAHRGLIDLAPSSSHHAGQFNASKCKEMAMTTAILSAMAGLCPVADVTPQAAQPASKRPEASDSAGTTEKPGLFARIFDAIGRVYRLPPGHEAAYLCY
jgi:hypothetical protein